jgi:flagellar protein FlaG
MVVAVVDAETQEVIRQIPSEEVLAIAARLDEARGLLFEGKA